MVFSLYPEEQAKLEKFAMLAWKPPSLVRIHIDRANVIHSSDRKIKPETILRGGGGGWVVVVASTGFEPIASALTTQCCTTELSYEDTFIGSRPID